MSAPISKPIPTPRTVYGTTTPFVGRTSEIEALYAGLRKVAIRKSLRHISVHGPAGIGKTRLVEELLAIIGLRTRALRVYRASFPASVHAPSFAILSQIVAQRFGVQPGEPDEEVRSRLIDGLSGTVDPRRVRDTAHLLAYLLELPHDDTSDETDVAGDDLLGRAQALLWDLLRTDAAEGTVVVVLDRWEQGSRAAREVVQALATALADAPILLVTLSREPVEWSATKGTRFVRILLPPLAPSDVETLLGAFVPAGDGVPPRLASLVLDRSGGNPRHLENLVRLLVRRGVLALGESGFRVRMDLLSAAPLPQTAEELARERVTGLSPTERETLTAAAVVGTTFWVGALRSMLRGSDAAIMAFDLLDDRGDLRLHTTLAALMESDHIRADGRSTVHGDQQLSFVNPDERPVLVAELEATALRKLHRLAAQWMESAVPHEPVPFYIATAAHLQAGRRPNRAAAALRTAAHGARAARDEGRARTLLQRAWEMADTDEAALKAAIAFDLAWTHLLSGAYVEAEAFYQRAAALAVIVGDVSMMGRAANHLGKIRLARGQLDLARVALDRAFELFERAQDVEGIASVREDLGKLIWHRAAPGAYREAMESFRRSLSLRRTLGVPSAIARSLTHIANIQSLTGRMAEAEKSHRDALALRRQAGDRRGEAMTLNGLAVTIAEKGDVAEALALWERALVLATEVGDRTLYALVLGNIAEANMAQGNLDEAERLLVEAADTAREVGNLRIHGYTVQTHAQLLQTRGDVEGALGLAGQALAIAEQSGNRHMLATSLRTRAQIAASRLNPTGDMTLPTANPAFVEDALTDLTEALRILEELGDMPALHRTLDAKATILEGVGMLVDAIPLRQRAKDIRKALK